MYSPKINEKLVPRLYRLAKAISEKTGKPYPMTRLVNKILEEYLNKDKPGLE